MAVLGEVTPGAQPSSPGPRQGEGRGPCERVSTASVRTREALQRLSSEAPDMRVAGGHVCVCTRASLGCIHENHKHSPSIHMLSRQNLSGRNSPGSRPRVELFSAVTLGERGSVPGREGTGRSGGCVGPGSWVSWTPKPGLKRCPTAAAL